MVKVFSDGKIQQFFFHILLHFILFLRQFVRFLYPVYNINLKKLKIYYFL